VHLVAECGRGLPVGFALTAGQASELDGLGPALRAVAVPRPRGRPRTRPARLACDKGYDFPQARDYLRRRGIGGVVPSRRRPARWRPRRGRPCAFDRAAYRRRNCVERCVGRLKEFRRVATRYEKLAGSYLAVVHVAAIRLYLRELTC
jgi:transposase